MMELVRSSLILALSPCSLDCRMAWEERGRGTGDEMASSSERMGK